MGRLANLLANLAFTTMRNANFLKLNRYLERTLGPDRHLALDAPIGIPKQR